MSEYICIYMSDTHTHTLPSSSSPVSEVILGLQAGENKHIVTLRLMRTVKLQDKKIYSHNISLEE